MSSSDKKKKRKKVHVEYKDEYSQSIIRGWMTGKSIFEETGFDDKNEDVFEPRPSRYATKSKTTESKQRIHTYIQTTDLAWVRNM